MKDPAIYIRKAFGDCIGGVVYDGKIIPVVDTFSDEDFGKNQIMLGSLEMVNSDDKHSFNGDYTFTIDVVTRTDNSGNRFIADSIANQITEKVQPLKQIIGLAISNEFQLINLRLDSSGYLYEGTKTHFIVRKLLRYRFRIVEL